MRTKRGISLKNRFFKITLILTMLLVMAIPAQACASEQKIDLNQLTAVSASNGKISTQLSSEDNAKLTKMIAQFSNSKYGNAELQSILEQAGSQKDDSTAVNPLILGDYEKQVVALVNEEREAEGLPALKVNTRLSEVSEAKAEDMKDNNYFSHTSPTYGSPFDMIKLYGISYSSAGENIAKGYQTPEAVVKGWMNSEGHKENILNASFTEIGMGYVSASDGTTYWVQDFIGN